MSNVIKDNYKHFDIEYDMSHVIKKNYKHFDV
jgi:hypothetical protein